MSRAFDACAGGTTAAVRDLMQHTSIHRATAVVIVMAAALTLAPRRAHACGQGGGSYGGLIAAFTIGAIVVGGTDLALTVWDVSSAARSHQPSIGYGVLETLTAGTQFTAGLLAMTGGARNGAIGLYTVWMGLLTTHGIWTIAKASSASTRVLEEPPPAPEDPVPLLQVGIGPTYVPVGQLAQPGIGLVGRF